MGLFLIVQANAKTEECVLMGSASADQATQAPTASTKVSI